MCASKSLISRSRFRRNWQCAHIKKIIMRCIFQLPIKYTRMPSQLDRWYGKLRIHSQLDGSNTSANTKCEKNGRTLTCNTKNPLFTMTLHCKKRVIFALKPSNVTCIREERTTTPIELKVYRGEGQQTHKK